jgi:excisionase family DNA binding protein
MSRKSAVISSPTVIISPRVLTIPQAALYIAATAWAVEELVRRNELRSYLQGQRRVIDMRELDKYVDRRNAEKPIRLVNRASNFAA